MSFGISVKPKFEQSKLVFEIILHACIDDGAKKRIYISLFSDSE